MPQVVLIGDSIRIAYAPLVIKRLTGEADIWHPTENGGTSANVLAHLGAWAVDRQPAIIHINAGLHDISTGFPDADYGDGPMIPGRPRSTVAEYEDNLHEILHRLTTQTSAAVIWAMTTPVNERWHHQTKGFDRHEADVIERNAVARRVAEHFNVTINDLYQVILDGGRDNLLTPDGVHFKPEGSVLLANAVAACVRQAMAQRV